MTSLLDLPTLQDFPIAHQMVVPSEDRNFGRPKEPLLSSTAPMDIAEADDASADILQVQQALSQFPGATKYQGPIDGQMNPALLIALQALELTWEQTYHHPFKNTIVSGGKFHPNGLKDGMKVIKQLKNKSVNNSSKIKDFQKFFGLPETGEPDAALIQRAQTVEKQIQTYTGQPTKNLLWDGHQFVTTVSDVQTALSLMQKNPKK